MECSNFSPKGLQWQRKMRERWQSACAGARSADSIPDLMRIFERSLKWRCEKVQAQARWNGEAIHMPDGEEQEHRDRKMTGKRLATDKDVDSGPPLDPTFTSWLYGHNTIEEVRISIYFD